MADYNKIIDKLFENEKNNNLYTIDSLVNYLLSDKAFNQISIGELNNFIIEQIKVATPQQIKRAKELINLGIRPPSDGGVATEYLFAFFLSKYLQIPLRSGKVLGATIQEKDIEDSINLIGFDTKKTFSIPNKDKIKDYVEKKFIVSNFYQDLIKKQYTPKEVVLTGELKSGISSSDVSIKFIDNQGKERLIDVSVKKKSPTLYQVGKSSDVKKTDDIKEFGGGIYKIYKIFNIEPPVDVKQPYQNKKIYIDLASKLKLKYSNKPVDIFTNLSALISRGDTSVEVLATVEKNKIVYPQIMNRFLDHINEIDFLFKETDAAYYIDFKISKTSNFDISIPSDLKIQKISSELEKNTTLSLSVSKKLYESFQNNFNNFDDKQKNEFVNICNQYNFNFTNENYDSFLQEIKSFVDNNIKKINNQMFLHIRSKRHEGKSKEDIFNNVVEAKSALYTINEVSEFFEYLSYKPEFKKLSDSIKNVLEISKQINNVKQKIKK